MDFGLNIVAVIRTKCHGRWYFHNKNIRHLLEIVDNSFGKTVQCSFVVKHSWCCNLQRWSFDVWVKEQEEKQETKYRWPAEKKALSRLNFFSLFIRWKQGAIIYDIQFFLSMSMHHHFSAQKSTIMKIIHLKARRSRKL